MIFIESQIVGCVWLEDPDFLKKEGKLGIYIWESGWRGLGVGREVINKILNVTFGILDLNTVVLHVREKNVRAINCYKSCGFVVTKEFPKREFPDGSYQGAYEMAVTKNQNNNDSV
jgi:RimJ/RimL family protein N-acetyltransferase